MKLELTYPGWWHISQTHYLHVFGAPDHPQKFVFTDIRIFGADDLRIEVHADATRLPATECRCRTVKPPRPLKRFMSQIKTEAGLQIARQLLGAQRMDEIVAGASRR